MSNDVQELASGKLILDEPAPHVARLRISNPDKRGALDHEILDTLAATVRDLYGEAAGGRARGSSARCLLLTGEGKMFSAGYDIGTFDDAHFEEQAEKLVAHPFSNAIEALDAFPFPSVAAINGHAIGGGLEVALSCDIRVAARGVKLGMPPARLGLIYSHTGLQKFIEVCGVANTSELFYTGRNVGADRGYEMGLVNQLVEPNELEQAGVSLAAEIAANAPLSLAGNKRVISELRRHPGKLPDDLERELVELRESCFRSEDFREGVQSFGEKRKPEWKGR